MFDLLLGFFFLLFNLDFGPQDGTIVIGLLPDFTGCLLLNSGLNKLRSETTYFPQARIYSSVLLCCSGLDYAMGLLGMYLFPLQMLVVLGKVVVIRIIIKGIGDIEIIRRCSLNSSMLKTLWIPVTVTLVLQCLFRWLSVLLPMLSMVGYIANILTGILFLIAFNKTRRAYNDL